MIERFAWWPAGSLAECAWIILTSRGKILSECVFFNWMPIIFSSPPCTEDTEHHLLNNTTTAEHVYILSFCKNLFSKTNWVMMDNSEWVSSPGSCRISWWGNGLHLNKTTTCQVTEEWLWEGPGVMQIEPGPEPSRASLVKPETASSFSPEALTFLVCWWRLLRCALV